MTEMIEQTWILNLQTQNQELRRRNQDGRLLADAKKRAASGASGKAIELAGLGANSKRPNHLLADALRRRADEKLRTERR